MEPKLTGAVALKRDGETDVAAWQCRTCETIFPSDYGDAANNCCPKRCAGDDCETVVERHRLCCPPCLKRHEAAVERERFEKAEKVAAKDYEGWVYSDVDPTHYGEGYYAGIEELDQHCESRGIAMPAYVWACDKTVAHSRADDVIEQALSEHHSDAGDQINSAQVDALQDVLDEWWADVPIVTWTMDYDRAVVLGSE